MLHVGDWFYVHLRPYRQLSISGTTYTKLVKRYYGPYQIIERVGVIAYKLALPSHSKIHLVFHCVLLMVLCSVCVCVMNERMRIQR